MTKTGIAASRDPTSSEEVELVKLVPVAYASKKSIENISKHPKSYHYLPVNGDAARGKTVTLYMRIE